jgi:hypothetical protein
MSVSETHFFSSVWRAAYLCARVSMFMLINFLGLFFLFFCLVWILLFPPDLFSLIERNSVLTVVHKKMFELETEYFCSNKIYEECRRVWLHAWCNHFSAYSFPCVIMFFIF